MAWLTSDGRETGQVFEVRTPEIAAARQKPVFPELCQITFNLVASPRIDPAGDDDPAEPAEPVRRTIRHLRSPRSRRRGAPYPFAKVAHLAQRPPAGRSRLKCAPPAAATGGGTRHLA